MGLCLYMEFFRFKLECPSDRRGDEDFIMKKLDASAFVWFVWLIFAIQLVIGFWCGNVAYGFWFYINKGR